MLTAPGSEARVLRVAVRGRLDPGLFDSGHGLVLAEVPVAEPHVRELVAAASNADAAVIVVEGRDEAAAAIRRDIHLLALLGVRRLVLVAKEPVASRDALSAMEAGYRTFASKVGLADFHCVAADALAGVLQSTPPAEPAADEPAGSADQFEAAVIWLAEAPLLSGRNYELRLAGRTAAATVAPLRYRINPETLEHVAASKLHLNEVGVCQLELDQAIPFEPYRRNHELGGFVLVDRLSGETVGAGMLHFELRRSQNVHWQALDIDRTARAALKGQRPCVLWFTGLSGAGKSTIANVVEKKLHAMGRHTYLLDGDNVRHGLNKDLGFTEQARVENIRRVAEVARLMADAGLIVLAAFISPFRSERRMARDLLPPGEFVEVFVDVPLEVAEQRDPKGLYRKARRGDLKNFTGVDSPYESPERAEVRIDTTSLSPEEAADEILAYLERRQISCR